jgi:hypothetical protein
MNPLALTIAQMVLSLGLEIAKGLNLNNDEIRAAIRQSLEDDYVSDQAWEEYAALIPNASDK